MKILSLAVQVKTAFKKKKKAVLQNIQSYLQPTLSKYRKTLSGEKQNFNYEKPRFVKIIITKLHVCNIYIVKKYSGNLHFIPQDAEINNPIFILHL